MPEHGDISELPGGVVLSSLIPGNFSATSSVLGVVRLITQHLVTRELWIGASAYFEDRADMTASHVHLFPDSTAKD